MREDRLDRSDDAMLVREVASGSQDALAILYDRYAAAIYGVACRLTADRQIAEEVVQETFLVLWNRAELYSPSAGSLAAWMHTIARNRTVDRLRAAGRRPMLVSLSAAAAASEDQGDAALERTVRSGTIVGGAQVAPDPADALEAADLRASIAVALESMPDPERRVIELAYRDELTQSEIAARLGWPLGTVKTRTRRGLRRLRGVLAGIIGSQPVAPSTASAATSVAPAADAATVRVTLGAMKSGE